MSKVKTGSKYIGFVPDFGCFATKPNKPYWDRALAAGATEEQLQKCAQLRYDDVPMEEAMKIMAPDMEKCPALGATLNSMYGFVQFRKSCTAELEGLKKIMPYCFEMHGKCHYVGGLHAYCVHEQAQRHGLLLNGIVEVLRP